MLCTLEHAVHKIIMIHLRGKTLDTYYYAHNYIRTCIASYFKKIVFISIHLIITMSINY